MVALMSEVQKPNLIISKFLSSIAILSLAYVPNDLIYLMKTNPCEYSSRIYFLEKVFYTVSEGVFLCSDQKERDQTTLVVHYYYSLLNK